MSESAPALFDPEHIATWSRGRSGMSAAATSELDGPITASTWWSSTNDVNAVRAVGTADVSSATVTVTGLPFTPPVRFISSTASCTGTVNADEIAETGPVTGASSPSASAPSTAGRAVVVDVVELERTAVDPPPLSHAVATTTRRVPRTTRARAQVVPGTAMARGYRRATPGPGFRIRSFRADNTPERRERPRWRNDHEPSPSYPGCGRGPRARPRRGSRPGRGVARLPRRRLRQLWAPPDRRRAR